MKEKYKANKLLNFEKKKTLPQVQKHICNLINVHQNKF
jgi:hypothetical protein